MKDLNINVQNSSKNSKIGINNKDVLPIQYKDRTITPIGYWIIKKYPQPEIEKAWYLSQSVNVKGITQISDVINK